MTTAFNKLVPEQILLEYLDRVYLYEVIMERYECGMFPCLQMIDVPLTDDQLTKLIDMLDEDGDGEVDYG